MHTGGCHAHAGPCPVHTGGAALKQEPDPGAPAWTALTLAHTATSATQSAIWINTNNDTLYRGLITLHSYRASTRSACNKQRE